MSEDGELKINPKLQELIPPLGAEERAQLEDNVLRDGCLDPLIAWRNGDLTLLDGHNRLEICRAHGLSFKVEEIELESFEDAAAWVEEVQLGRRNLTDDQRAMVGAEHKKRLSKLRRQERARTANDVKYGRRKPSLEATVSTKEKKERTRSEVARKHKISERKLRAAEELLDSNPAEARRVRNGEAPLKATLKKDKKKRKEAESEKKAAKLPNLSQRYKLHVTTCAKAAKLIDESSIDWLITDPPYKKEFLPAYADLAKLGKHALKPGGLALVMIGQSYLPEIIAALSKELTYHWTIAYLTPGGQAVYQAATKANAFWKPVLIYRKEKYKGDAFGDVTRSNVNDNDKKHHDWGQSLSGMKDLMSRFVKPGETVLDPFVGGGTTAVAALEMGALFIGSDSSAKAINETKVRIEESCRTDEPHQESRQKERDGATLN